MGWREIIQLIAAALTGAIDVVRDILRRTGHLDNAEPWLSMGTIGLRYLEQLMQANSREEIMEIITRSPRELWTDAEDVEIRNGMIRQMQLDRVGEDRDGG